MPFTPEIVNDALYGLIKRITEQTKPKTIIEIGSANGMGSTQAFIEGVKDSKDVFMYAIEGLQDRASELAKNVKELGWIEPINEATVPFEFYMDEDEIRHMMSSDIPIKTKNFPVDMVLGWRLNDFKNIHPGHCLSWIMNEVKHPVITLIDGSPFTGDAELLYVWGSEIILLDDTYDIKNWKNLQRLKNSPSYELIEENSELRNGYAAFRKKVA